MAPTTRLTSAETTVGVAHDMIEELAAGEVEQTGSSSEEIARALGALIPMAVVDEEGRLRSVNRRWCAVLDRTPGEVIGRHWGEVVAAPPGLPALGASVREQGATSFDGRVQLANGCWAALRCDLAPLSDDPHPRRWLLVVHPDRGSRGHRGC